MCFLYWYGAPRDIRCFPTRRSSDLEVRGEGLMAALEFVKDRKSRTLFDPADKIGIRVSAACMERGLIARAMPQGDILGFAPPLCLTNDEASEIVRIAKEAVDAVAMER